MTFDPLHAILTSIILFATIWIVNHTAAFEGMTKRKRSLALFAILFVLLFVLNMIWPYGSST